MQILVLKEAYWSDKSIHDYGYPKKCEKDKQKCKKTEIQISPLYFWANSFVTKSEKKCK